MEGTMVDFAKLAPSGQQSLPKTLLETFARLDRQVSHVELRPSQIKVLDLIDGRLAERDLVVKLNTGGGKTTIGLIYLKHKLDRLRQPVAYLVPTTQLLSQVVSEGRRVGISVYPWLAGESYPPEEALNGKGVIVCTYDKFFNGKSTFARADVRLIPSAIVLDDVHAGIESVRKCFTCELPAEARAEILDLLGADLEKLVPGAWAAVSQENIEVLLEVPHWVFSSHLVEFRKTISRYASDSRVVFAWQHLSERLDLCRLVLSGRGASLALDPPQVEHIPHYFDAMHRVFMSASMHDGAALIRELGCDAAAAAQPVELGIDAAVGERMVVVPSLASPDFSRSELGAVAQMVKEHANVVVLVPSFAEAKFWGELGAVVADNESIEQRIDQLKQSDRGLLVVFVQRYDGVDLPDKACRLLIIDGLPYGEGLVDRADMEVAGGVVGVRGKIANRMEQGLGRAVRSASDYCVALLAGRDVAGFISRGKVRDHFSPHTVRQIEIGEVVSKALEESTDRIKDIFDTVMQCLRRDPSWKEFYTSQMKVEPTDMDGITQAAIIGRGISLHERRALSLADSRNYIGAKDELQPAFILAASDRRLKGVLKQVAAKYLYAVDQVQSMKLQASAYGDNFNVSRPPAMIPADMRRVSGQAEHIAEWLSDFADKNGALIELDGLRANLSFAKKYREVEAAIEKLGLLLGADSTRPENIFNRGPDNLWIFGDVAFVIEMKSEKKAALCKGDAEQLQHSMLWVEQNCPGVAKRHGIIGSNSMTADVIGDFAFGAHVIDEHAFLEMVDRLRNLAGSLCSQGPLFSGSAANVQKVLNDFSLTPAQLILLAKDVRKK
jgi:hypothetical protein